MSVLVWGVATEPPIAMVLAELAAAEIHVVLVHPREAAHQAIEVIVGPRPSEVAVDGWIEVAGRRTELGAIVGAYLRPVEPELVPELLRLPASSPQRRHARRVHEALVAFTEVAGKVCGCKVANRLSAMASNLSKPLQAQAIIRHGFSTPSTLVSDDPDEVMAFAAEYGEIVYKSTSGVRSIVRSFDPQADKDRLDRLRWCPVQFQERVRGPDIRVHVIGRDVWAARIETDAVDYRYARSQAGQDARIIGHQLSSEIAQRCIALANELELPFAGIDLKLAQDGRVVCFEVNPSPGFTWFEAEARLPIAASLARWLSGQ